MPKIKKNNNPAHPVPVGNPVPPAAPAPLSLINVILDKSGSMHSVKDATISGFNEYKNDQARQPGDTFFGLTVFDTTFNVIHAVEPIANVPDLNDGSYAPSGSTALYDAIAYTVQHVDERIAKLPRTPDSVLFVILTDGEENASREFNRDQIKQLISDAEKDKHYDFIYLGANQDAWNVGTSFGIQGGNTLNYSADPNSMKKTMNNLSAATTRYRNVSANIDSSMDVDVLKSNFWAPDDELKKDKKKPKK